ncbi:hypothetical protein [Burkholderia pseudomallei]|nr:hypothetical protein [Burkholderia pseudomallei]
MSQLASSPDDSASAATQTSKPGSAVVQPIPRAALLPQRLGFLVSNTLSDDEIEDLLQKMDDNDERIYELVKKETQSGLFGGPTEQTVDDTGCDGYCLSHRTATGGRSQNQALGHQGRQLAYRAEQDRSAPANRY